MASRRRPPLETFTPVRQMTESLNRYRDGVWELQQLSMQSVTLLYSGVTGTLPELAFR